MIDSKFNSMHSTLNADEESRINTVDSTYSSIIRGMKVYKK